MADSSTLLFSGSNFHEFGASYSQIAATLPLDVKQKLAKVFKDYSVAYGFDGVYERMKGRTVDQVFDEYEQPEFPPVVATGERDGMRYTLYDAPPAKKGE